MSVRSDVPASPETPSASIGATSTGPPGWVWGALIALAALAAVYRSAAPDYWFHLGAGRSIASHGFPSQEPWNLAAGGSVPFLAGWPYQLGLYEVYRLGGDFAVALWREGWVVLAAALAFALLRTVGGASWTAVLLVPLVIAASRDALRVRPEQVLPPLVLFALLELERARRHAADRTRRLIPAQVLWANAHSSWVIGPVLTWIYSATEWWGESDPKKTTATETPAQPPRSKPWIVLGLVLWAASALTPTPLITLATPWRFLGPLRLSAFAAWFDWLRRWSWSAEWTDPFTALALLWLIALAIAGRRLWREAPGLTITTVLTMALGFWSAQFRDVAAWTAFVPIALALRPAGPGWLSRLRAAPAAAAAVAGLLWLALAPGFPLGTQPITRGLPVQAVSLADSVGMDGPTLNTPESGGYILAVRGDAHPPLVDPRLRGSEEFWGEYVDALIVPYSLDRFVEKWQFTHAIVSLPPREEDHLASILSRLLEWALVSYDDGGCLFVRWGRHPELDARAYRYLSAEPTVMTGMIVRSRADSGLARRLESELLRARASSPYHARADVWLGELALAHSRVPEAVRLLEEAERIAPHTPRLAIAQGRAYQAAGNSAKSRAAFERALGQPDEADEARMMIDRPAGP